MTPVGRRARVSKRNVFETRRMFVMGPRDHRLRRLRGRGGGGAGHRPRPCRPREAQGAGPDAGGDDARAPRRGGYWQPVAVQPCPVAQQMRLPVDVRQQAPLVFSPQHSWLLVHGSATSLQGTQALFRQTPDGQALAQAPQLRGLSTMSGQVRQ